MFVFFATQMSNLLDICCFFSGTLADGTQQTFEKDGIGHQPLEISPTEYSHPLSVSFTTNLKRCPQKERPSIFNQTSQRGYRCRKSRFVPPATNEQPTRSPVVPFPPLFWGRNPPTKKTKPKEMVPQPLTSQIWRTWTTSLGRR